MVDVDLGSTARDEPDEGEGATTSVARWGSPRPPTADGLRPVPNLPSADPPVLEGVVPSFWHLVVSTLQPGCKQVRLR